MKKLSQNTHGFTVIELLVVILVLSIVAVLAITNIRGLRAEKRDTISKTDINAVYYQLESFYEKNNYYPEQLSVDTLKGLDPESLKDDLGIAVNDLGGLYTYKPNGCSEAKCKSFELSARLEREAPYTKNSLNK